MRFSLQNGFAIVIRGHVYHAEVAQGFHVFQKVLSPGPAAVGTAQLCPLPAGKPRPAFLGYPGNQRKPCCASHIVF